MIKPRVVPGFPINIGIDPSGSATLLTDNSASVKRKVMKLQHKYGLR